MIITILSILIAPSLIAVLLFNKLKSETGNYEFKMGMLDGSFNLAHLWMAMLAPGINYLILFAMLRDIAMDIAGKSERKKKEKELKTNPHYKILNNFIKVVELYSNVIATTPRAENYMKLTKTIRKNIDDKAVQFILSEYDQVFINTLLIHEESKELNLANREKVLKKRLEILDQFEKEVVDYEKIQEQFKQEYEQKTFDRLMEQSEKEHNRLKTGKIMEIKKLVQKKAV